MNFIIQSSVPWGATCLIHLLTGEVLTHRQMTFARWDTMGGQRSKISDKHFSIVTPGLFNYPLFFCSQYRMMKYYNFNSEILPEQA